MNMPTNIYDVFETNGNNSFNKEEWSAKKQEERKKVYELIDTTCEKMMSDGEHFQKYLDVQGRFDRYSTSNAILISAQMPQATQLKEWNKWKQSRVYVNKDAQKISILEPGKEYTRDDGTKAMGCNVKTVYDISQTSAAKKQTVEHNSMRDLLKALISASPVDCKPIDDLELPAFYDREDETIYVKKGMNNEMLFVSIAKEVASAVYDFKYGESRDNTEYRASYVSYMLSVHYGVDTRGFNFEQLPERYANMDVQDFRAELDSMRDVLREVSTDMYKSLERAKGEKNKEQVR